MGFNSGFKGLTQLGYRTSELSQYSYLLALDSSRKLGVIIADVRLQAGNVTA